MTQPQEPIGINEFLGRLEAEVYGAKPRLFAISEVKLELKVAVSKEAKGGINIQVVQLGGSGHRDDTQTVTITFLPRPPDNPSIA